MISNPKIKSNRPGFFLLSVLSGIFLILFSPLLFAQNQAGITPENCYEFLELGTVTYNINISMGQIDYSDSIITRQIKVLEQELAGSPNDVEKIIKLLEFYEESNHDSKAKALAEEKMSIIKSFYEQKKDEFSATAYARALYLMEDKERLAQAYSNLVPFLNTSQAKIDTCLVAIENRLFFEDFALAGRLIDHYLAVYPQAAELYYKKFFTQIQGNIQNTAASVFGTVANEILSKSGQNSINEKNIKAFISTYLTRVDTAIDIEMLTKAADLAPQNYEYNLAAAAFKAITNLFTLIWTLSNTQGIEGGDILKIVKEADGTKYKDIDHYLTRANRIKPARDIQLPLAFALYNCINGNFARAKRFAQQAIDLKPQAIDGYDAMLFILIFSSIVENNNIDIPTVDTVESVLHQKLQNIEADILDYYALSGFSFHKYGLVGPAEQKEELEQMKKYLHNMLDIQSDNIMGLIGMANYNILIGNYIKAIDILSDLPDKASPEQRLFIYNNLGVAEVLKGEIEAGIEDFNKALEIDQQNYKTLNALGALKAM